MHVNSRKLIGVLVILSSFLFYTTTTLAAVNDDAWVNGSLTQEGYGAAPANALNAGHARILARRAAIVDAYRNLAEYAEGVRVDAETTVKDMAVRDDLIRTRVSAVIKGAKIISEKQNSDGSYSVILQIPMYGAGNSLSSAVLPSWSTIESFPTPEISYPSTYPASQEPVDDDFSYRATGNYTGLIVDCRGLDLQPVMSPVIKNAQNEPIYGYKNLDYDKVIKNGMAGYSKDGYTNLQRAGNNPLRVTALRLDNHNSNPVLSLKDARRVLLENQATGFLNNCAVVFIR